MTAYSELPTPELRSLQKQYRKNLALLEAKKSKFGDLYVPTNVVQEIDDTLQAIESIQQELRGRPHWLHRVFRRSRSDGSPISAVLRGVILAAVLAVSVLAVILAAKAAQQPLSAGCTIQSSKLSVERSTLAPNERVKASVRVENPQGRVLIYTWRAVSGRVDPPGRSSFAEITYTAPAMPTDDTISVEIILAGCQSVSLSQEVSVVSAVATPTTVSAPLSPTLAPVALPPMTRTLNVLLLIDDRDVAWQLYEFLDDQLKTYDISQDIDLRVLNDQRLLDADYESVAKENGADLIVFWRFSKERSLPFFYVPDSLIEEKEIADKINVVSLKSEYNEVITEIKYRSLIVVTFLYGLHMLLKDNPDEARVQFVRSMDIIETFIDNRNDESKSYNNLISVIQFYIGRSLLDLDDYEGADKAFELSIQANSKYAWSYVGQGNVLMYQAMNTIDDRDEQLRLFDKAESKYNIAFDLTKKGVGTSLSLTFTEAKIYQNIGYLYLLKAEDNQRYETQYDNQFTVEFYDFLSKSEEYLMSALLKYGESRNDYIDFYKSDIYRILARIYEIRGNLDLRERYLALCKEYLPPDRVDFSCND